MTTARQQHIVALDGLRGIAIISVIAAHANEFFGGTFAHGGVAQPLAAIFGCGWVGVDLFFVLSGFLITGILCDAKGSKGFLPNFWARRALRIMPLYFGYLSFIIVVAYVRPGLFGIEPISFGGIAALAAYYYNFWIAFGVAFATQTPIETVNHFWSLSVEEHFYLIWPVLVMTFSQRALIRICIVGFMASLVFRLAVVSSGLYLEVAYLITPCRLDGLLAGAFVALAFRDATTLAIVQRWRGRVVLASGFLLLGLLLGQRHFVHFVDLRRMSGPAVDSSMTLTVGITALSLLFAGALARIVESPANSAIQRFLKAGWLVKIGRFSYAMYVFHVLVIFMVTGASRRLAPSAMSLPDYLAKPVLVLLVLFVSYITALISYHFFEKHFLHLKRYFAYRAAGVDLKTCGGYL